MSDDRIFGTESVPAAPRSNAATRFKPGNPGKPKGARSKATLAAEALLDGEAKAITRKAIELAKAGDLTAINICLSRIIAPRRERAVRFALPPVSTAADHPAALAAIVAAVSAGELSPGDAHSISGVLAEHRKAIEASDHEARLAALETRIGR